MSDDSPLIGVIGPTASGKSAKAVALAQKLDGEVISVDSRQVYRGLDIGTEKTSLEEMQGIPHHLIDIRDPEETYSAGDFVADATRLIEEIRSRGKTPILAGGTHFYFDALLYGLPPDSPANPVFRATLEELSTDELYHRIRKEDPRRAARIDPHNRRRLIRALELVSQHGQVPERSRETPQYPIQWVVINPSKEELRPRIEARLEQAFARGLIGEVESTRARVGDARLDELGLEYRVIGEFLRGERERDELVPVLSAKLWHYARHQKKWLRKLLEEESVTEAS